MVALNASTNSLIILPREGGVRFSSRSKKIECGRRTMFNSQNQVMKMDTTVFFLLSRGMRASGVQ